MKISHFSHRCLPNLLILLSAACPASGPEVGLEPGSTGSTSTGEATPDTPTGAGPSSSGDAASSSSGEPDTSSSGFADPGELCGDGIPGLGEQCDDGEANDPYGPCTDTCQVNVCGDGKVLVGTEECDEGPDNVDTGYCRMDCKLGVCGDGFLFAGLEECDAGVGSDAYGKCDASCTVNRCGDGELDPGFEECDEGPNNGAGGGEGGKVGCDLDCGLAGRRLFLSSQLFDGDLGTRAGADLACQIMAKAAHFKNPERFRALLADAEVGPADFVAEDPEERPFILPSGLIVAASYAALIQGGPGDGITMTE
ncbi:MAG TPA: hypothetical protein VGB85_34100, partial [Nannocystis sp.]